MSTLLDAIEIETADNPTAAVIWLHGLGADGSDFVPLVPELDLSGCEAIRFVFPHAPSIPVTINNGYVMPAWYDIRGTDLIAREDEAGIRASQLQIEVLIAREKSRGIAANKIILAGFSQGCAMALQVGLRHPEKLAGLMGLSGYLPLHAHVPSEYVANHNNVPIFLAHGQNDPVVPIQRAIDSHAVLRKLGYQVTWREYAMEHTLCIEEVADIGNWLKKVLA